jgi:hypothetical protein
MRGHWSIRPSGDWTSSRRYEDRTLVLETTFTTATGVLVLTDLLALGPNGGHRLGTNVPYLLIRRVACTSDSVEVNIAYAPRPEYGLVVPLLAHVDGGVTARGGAERLVLTAPLDLQLERGTVYGQLTLNAGQTIHLALHRSTLEQTPAHIWSESELAATVNASVADLQSWSDIHQTYDGPGMDQRPSVAGVVPCLLDALLELVAVLGCCRARSPIGTCGIMNVAPCSCSPTFGSRSLPRFMK